MGETFREHELKCWPEPFEALKDGRKRFEWRYDDRGFAVGDILKLCKYDPHSRSYGERFEWLRVRVTYILRGQFGIPEGYVVMGVEPETR